jgi:hypothetical protein
MRHKSGVTAFAIEQDNEFIVLADSQALKDTGYASLGYADLKADLIAKGVLVDCGQFYVVKSPYAFKSPSAAAAVVLDRNANGRTEWKVTGAKMTYHEWQEAIAGVGPTA